MNCKNCGSPLNEGEKFCNKCGTPTVEEKVITPTVDPKTLVVKPMGEPTNEFAKLAKPEDHKPVVVRNTNPILLIVVFLIAVAIGYFGYNFLSSKDNNFVSLNGYHFDIPNGLKIDYQKDTLYLDNDDLKFSINILDGDYTKIKADSFDDYKYQGEKEFESKKYHLFTKDDSKIVIMSIDDNKLVLMGISTKEDNIDKVLKIVVSAKKNESNKTLDNDKLILDMKSIINVEEENTGDIEDAIYEDTYVEITLEEINE